VDVVCDDGSIARAAVLHRDPELAALAEELKALPPAGGPLDPERIVANGQVELAAEVPVEPEPRAGQAPPSPTAAILRRLAVSSFVAVPLLARGRRLGVLTLVQGTSGRRFDPFDVPFVEQLGARCALALDNARLFKEAEETRRLAEQSARVQEDAARFGEQLLGIVSHDLRSPLAAILASTQLALKRCGEDEIQVRALKRATSSAARMGRMIDELLDFTRARLGGGIPLRKREADLGKIARYAVEEAQAAHPEHPLVHRIHYEKGALDPTAWARWCRTSSPTPCSTGRRARRWSWTCGRTASSSSWRWRTRVPPSPRSSCPGSSSPSAPGPGPGPGEGDEAARARALHRAGDRAGPRRRGERALRGRGTVFTVRLPRRPVPGP